MNLIILSVACFLGLLGLTTANNTKESVQVINHPNVNEFHDKYIKIRSGSEKHNYGYELGDGTNFHHTTTEDDGVRLGCYGFRSSGKMISTQYVADMNGYRLVSPHRVFTVYPKSGGERKALFADEFDDEDLRNRNVKYFFPGACKVNEEDTIQLFERAPIVNVNGLSRKRVVPTPATLPPTIALLTSSNRNLVVPPTLPPTVPPLLVSIERSEIPGQEREGPITKTERKIPPPPPKISSRASIFSIVETEFPRAPINSCCSDDEPPTVVTLTIAVKSLGKSKGSCKSYVKMTIPVDALDSHSLYSLTNGYDKTEMAQIISQLLS